MKEILSKISNVLKTVFGYCIMATLLLGGITTLGYIVALIIGGNTAVVICEFIYVKLFPILIYITTVMILVGILAMYLVGEIALTPDKKKSSKEEAER